MHLLEPLGGKSSGLEVGSLGLVEALPQQIALGLGLPLAP